MCHKTSLVFIQFAFLLSEDALSFLLNALKAEAPTKEIK